RLRVIEVPRAKLFGATWIQRCWSHQEYLFSPRCIVFGDKRVIWEYKEVLWKDGI
ncbi:hypothetical protein K432DRAFT_259763, partial [Lepidopterella palustris CBS 459.81]